MQLGRTLVLSPRSKRKQRRRRYRGTKKIDKIWVNLKVSRLVEEGAFHIRRKGKTIPVTYQSTNLAVACPSFKERHTVRDECVELCRQKLISVR